MAETSHIEWTDATWNPVTGCSVVSPGCTNCYAMKLAGTRLHHHRSRAGLTQETKAGPVWTGEVRLNDEWLDQPLRWRRPRRIFVCAHGDLFHESVPDEWIDRVFAVMALCPQHTFQVLTKRADRMREYVARFEQTDWLGNLLDLMDEIGAGMGLGRGSRGFQSWPLPNVWLGVSVEDQQRADERIPDLLATPAAVRFLSCEPLLGAVDLEPWLDWPRVPIDQDPPEVNGREWGCADCESEMGFPSCECPRDKAHYHVEEGPKDADGCPAWVTAERVTLDWVICGGESGPGARPLHPDWARSLRDQCAAAGVPFFFKQWGAFKPTSDCEHGEYMVPASKKAAGRLLDGVAHDGMPA